MIDYIKETINIMGSVLEFVVMCLLLMMSTFLSSLIPILAGSNPKIINIISMFGAGLLVGVTLIIIIPEGVKAIYKNTFYAAATDKATIIYGDIGIHFNRTI